MPDGRRRRRAGPQRRRQEHPAARRDGPAQADERARSCFDGEDITRLAPHERVARGMAYVPQGQQSLPAPDHRGEPAARRRRAHRRQGGDRRGAGPVPGAAGAAAPPGRAALRRPAPAAGHRPRADHPADGCCCSTSRPRASSRRWSPRSRRPSSSWPRGAACPCCWSSSTSASRCAPPTLLRAGVGPGHLVRRGRRRRRGRRAGGAGGVDRSSRGARSARDSVRDRAPRCDDPSSSRITPLLKVLRCCVDRPRSASDTMAGPRFSDAPCLGGPACRFVCRSSPGRRAPGRDGSRRMCPGTPDRHAQVVASPPRARHRPIRWLRFGRRSCATRWSRKLRLDG